MWHFHVWYWGLSVGGLGFDEMILSWRAMGWFKWDERIYLTHDRMNVMCYCLCVCNFVVNMLAAWCTFNLATSRGRPLRKLAKIYV